VSLELQSPRHREEPHQNSSKMVSMAHNANASPYSRLPKAASYDGLEHYNFPQHTQHVENAVQALENLARECGCSINDEESSERGLQKDDHRMKKKQKQ
jgi:hypothetical protein